MIENLILLPASQLCSMVARLVTSVHLEALEKVIPSSLLFILCSEVLSRLLIREEEAGRLKGIKVGRQAPAIAHLLFADNL